MTDGKFSLIIHGPPATVAPEVLLSLPDLKAAKEVAKEVAGKTSVTIEGICTTRRTDDE